LLRNLLKIAMRTKSPCLCVTARRWLVSILCVVVVVAFCLTFLAFGLGGHISTQHVMADDSSADAVLFKFLTAATELPIRAQGTVIKERRPQEDGSLVYICSFSERDAAPINFSVRIAKDGKDYPFVTAFIAVFNWV
jgi:hypothetical protein